MSASPLWLPRLDEPEWLDDGRGSAADVEDNLDEMWRLNRWLGGVRALTRHLYPRLLAVPGPASVLDLGTGAAHFPAAIAAWARRQRTTVNVFGLDWAARNLAVARWRSQPVGLLQADAQRPPLAAGAVDFVISSLFLHHFTSEAVIALLRTGYADAWTDRAQYFGWDSTVTPVQLHFPSFGEEGIRFLIAERRVAAVGADVASTDAGSASSFPVHRMLAEAGIPGFENLADMSDLPAKGAFVIALTPRIVGGSGGPLRAVALVPSRERAGRR